MKSISEIAACFESGANIVGTAYVYIDENGIRHVVRVDHVLHEPGLVVSPLNPDVNDASNPSGLAVAMKSYAVPLFVADNWKRLVPERPNKRCELSAYKGLFLHLALYPSHVDTSVCYMCRTPTRLFVENTAITARKPICGECAYKHNVWISYSRSISETDTCRANEGRPCFYCGMETNHRCAGSHTPVCPKCAHRNGKLSLNEKSKKKR